MRNHLFRLVPIAILLVANIFAQLTIHTMHRIVDFQTTVIKQDTNALKDASEALKSCGSALPGKSQSAVQQKSKCAIVHEFNGHCPAGYAREAKPRFTEKDGSKEYACLSSSPKQDNCTDFLRPGEGETMHFTFPLKPEPATDIAEENAERDTRIQFNNEQVKG